MSTKLSPQFLAEKTWDLYQTHGVPIEVSLDILEKNNLELDQELLDNLIESHQKLSQSNSAGQFKSGLGTDTNKTRALHTTTHILHQVLREIFSDQVRQMGSAITEEKARFDVSISANEIDESKLEQIQNQVQNIIDRGLQMVSTEMNPEQAKELGAIGLFGEKYGEQVTVYSLTDKENKVFSREFCGGPHVKNTSQVGKFKILKKKSIGSGLTRIEFDLE
jgi:alanyl-tRNA synthetase